MQQKHLHNNLPALQDIIAAAKPGTADAVRLQLRNSLEQMQPEDDAMQGVKDFLEDHDYDFDALHDFLNFSITQKAGIPQLKRTLSLRRLSVAAVLITVLATGGWLFFSNWQREKVLLAAVIYEPGLPVFVSINGNKDFNEMMSAYRLGDGKDGLGYYHKLIASQAENDTLHYFGGWLYYLNKQYDSASVCFDMAQLHTAAVYANKAEYMLAISRYRMQDKVGAREILMHIMDDKNNSYREKAAELLKEKSLW